VKFPRRPPAAAREWDLPAPAVGGQLARAGCEQTRASKHAQEGSGEELKLATFLRNALVACGVRWRTIVMIIGEAATTAAAVHVHRDIYNVMNEHSAGVVLGVALSARGGRRRCCLHARIARSARRRRKRRKQQLANCDRFFARLLFPSSANISACAALLL
jgi:hypothetical protein